jgi:beta-phosphoglucomutase-like phosphatase (HAD superfamily)
MVKAAFFDIDGTLVDTNGFHVLAWDEALRHDGFGISRGRIGEQIGKGGDMLLPSLIPDITPEHCKRIADRHGRIFAKRYLRRAKPFASAKQLIERLARSGVKIILASSAQRMEVDHYAALLDIGRFLSGVVSADDVQRSKPAADIFAVALQMAAPINASDAVVIGDTAYDVESAAQSRLRMIGVRSGGFSDQAVDGSVAIYDNVKALLRQDVWRLVESRS